jgi:hypothetical protein
VGQIKRKYLLGYVLTVTIKAKEEVESTVYFAIGQKSYYV